MNQIPNDYFDLSNVAYPIYLRNEMNSNKDPIVASLRWYLYANCHYVILVIVWTSNAQAMLWYCSITAVPLWARRPKRLGWGAELTHTATGEW